MNEDIRQALDRLEREDDKLLDRILDTERELRRDYEAKIASAVHSVQSTVQSTHLALKEDIDEVKESLKWQNKIWVAPGAITICSGVLYLALHYIFHFTL